MALYKNGKRIAGNGKSAYQQAVDGGFSGTESDFNKTIGKTHTHTNKEILDQITPDKMLEWDNKADAQALGGCTLEIIDGVPHICWDDGEVSV